MNAHPTSRQPGQPHGSRSRRRSGGFSLVEIVISMAIIATGMIAIIGLIPVGLEASRDAAVHTVTAIILENVHDQLEGEYLFQDQNEPHQDETAKKPFYYDDQGLFLSIPGEDEMAAINDAAGQGNDEADAAKDALDALLFKRRYRVNVRIKKVLKANKVDPALVDVGNAFGLEAGASDVNDDVNEKLKLDRFRAVIVDLYSPVNPASGEPMGRTKEDPVTGEIVVLPLTSVTYYLTTLTGIHWENIDDQYEPKIEF